MRGSSSGGDNDDEMTKYVARCVSIGIKTNMDCVDYLDEMQHSVGDVVHLLCLALMGRRDGTVVELIGA